MTLASRAIPLGAIATLACAACQPAAFPRTAEVAPHGKITAEVHMQTGAWEPQRTVTADGRELRAEAAFFPMLSGGFRVGVRGCEFGGAYAMTRVLGEVRCGILQERNGAPFSLATSGAIGIDYGPVTRPVGRVGVDLSVRLGPVRPLVDVYLSTADQLRWIEDPWDPPPDGPVPGSKSVVRTEVRLTVPFGIAIEIVRPDPRAADQGDRSQPTWSLVLGATPFTVLHASRCTGCLSWKGDGGIGFIVGLEAH